LRAFCDPLVVSLESYANFIVENSEIAVATAQNGAGQDGLYFLRDHTNVRLVLAIVGEAIEAKANIEAAKEYDVVLEHHVGPPPAAAASTAATAASKAPAAPAAEAPAHTAAAAP
jgi:hypothetical protein